MAKLTRGFECMSDRYKYDFRLCTSDKGWAQLDTKQDASYFGNWINPLTLTLLSYCEGDVTLTECENEMDFIATVRECVEWHSERDYFLGIDGMCCAPIIEAFARMNLSEFLH
jgi:hypothetical protein